MRFSIVLWLSPGGNEMSAILIPSAANNSWYIAFVSARCEYLLLPHHRSCILHLAVSSKRYLLSSRQPLIYQATTSQMEDLTTWRNTITRLSVDRKTFCSQMMKLGSRKKRANYFQRRILWNRNRNQKEHQVLRKIVILKTTWVASFVDWKLLIGIDRNRAILPDR